MLIGYARVSTEEQDNKLQIDALTKAGCEKIYQEKESGKRWDRPELHRLIDGLREGDEVIVWKMDRLSRSLKDLLFIIEKIWLAKAGIKSVTEPIDTTTAAGVMFMHMVGSFAEYERAILINRTQEGLIAAAKEGRKGGRRPKLSTKQQAEIVRLVTSGEKTAADAARLFDVHPSTISRVLNNNKKK